jgi:uncharacterized membrane protein
MAPQKQAKRRQAVSAKQRASHGNNRGRSQVSYDPAAAKGSAAPPAGATGPGLAQAMFRPKTRNWTGTAAATDSPSLAVDMAAVDSEAPLPRRMLGWVRDHPLHFTVWLISALALAVSVYLTITHYDTGVTLACSDKGLVNCAKVTSSSQSMVFGIIPVAVLGLAFYCFMFLINSPWGWRINRPEVRWLRLGSVVIGMGFVLYLIYAEVIQIGNICLWCTSVHILTFLMFILVIYDATSWTSSAASRRG